jgi:HAD superfamily hydrolase (TIGR01509 family)
VLRISEVRAVAFDLDGVLIDTETINVRAAFEGFEAHGYPLDASDAVVIVGRHPIDYVPDLARRHAVPESLLPSITRRQSEVYFRRWKEDARLLDGALEALDACRERGYPMALATSSGRASVEEALDRFGLRPYFSTTLTKDDVSVRKPDPEIYLLAAERLGVAPGNLLVLEDSPHGVCSAKGAGAMCVSVAGAEGADLRIESLRDLPGLLRGHSAFSSKESSGKRAR